MGRVHAANTSLNGISNAGKIVGQAESLGKWKGFAYDGVTLTDVIVSCDKCQSTIAYGINQWGDVVGSYFTGDRDWGFVMINGGPVAISPADAVNSVATGINAQDQIVGTYTDGHLVVHGFLDVSGSFSLIDVPQGGRRVPSTSITGLNDQGRITGNYLDNHDRSTDSFSM